LLNIFSKSKRMFTKMLVLAKFQPFWNIIWACSHRLSKVSGTDTLIITFLKIVSACRILSNLIKTPEFREIFFKSKDFCENRSVQNWFNTPYFTRFQKRMKIILSKGSVKIIASNAWKIVEFPYFFILTSTWFLFFHFRKKKVRIDP